MIKTLIGAAIGRRIDRARGGRGGLGGAAVGAMVTRLATRSIPGALAVGAGALAVRHISKRREAKRNGGATGPDRKPPSA